RDRLVAAGLQEVITYSLTTPEREAPLGLPAADYVRLLNPISSERVVLRHSLLTGVLEVTAANLKHAEDVRLFEVGSVYLPRPRPSTWRGGRCWRGSSTWRLCARPSRRGTSTPPCRASRRRCATSRWW